MHDVTLSELLRKKIVVPLLAVSNSPRHTPGHVRCPVCDRERMGQMEQTLHGELTFREAFDLWIKGFEIKHETLLTDAKYLAEGSFTDYETCARALAKFFDGEMKLGAIHTGNIEAYQKARAFNEYNGEPRWAAQAGANCIRKEIAMLLRVLAAAGCWNEDKGKKLKRLKAVELDVERALSPDEQSHWLTVAGSKDEWVLVYAYSIVALQTTSSTKEMRRLRIDDIKLTQSIIQIKAKSAKNRGRIRTIPIQTTECRWACEYLIYRAQQLGSFMPHHYLFPFGNRGGHSYDPDKPMGNTGLRSRWNEVRAAAHLPWLRIYDLRHSGCTRMAENGESVHTIMSMTGHLTVRMQQHYTAISMMAKRKAVASTWSAGVPKPSYGVGNPMKRSA